MLFRSLSMLDINALKEELVTANRILAHERGSTLSVMPAFAIRTILKRSSCRERARPNSSRLTTSWSSRSKERASDRSRESHVVLWTDDRVI